MRSALFTSIENPLLVMSILYDLEWDGEILHAAAVLDRLPRLRAAVQEQDWRDPISVHRAAPSIWMAMQGICRSLASRLPPCPEDRIDISDLFVRVVLTTSIRSDDVPIWVALAGLVRSSCAIVMMSAYSIDGLPDSSKPRRGDSNSNREWCCNCTCSQADHHLAKVWAALEAFDKQQLTSPITGRSTVSISVLQSMREANSTISHSTPHEGCGSLHNTLARSCRKEMPCDPVSTTRVLRDPRRRVKSDKPPSQNSTGCHYHVRGTTQTDANF